MLDVSYINRLRHAFGRCPVCASKQIGLRRLRDAKLFHRTNPEYATKLVQEAEYLLDSCKQRSFTRVALSA